MTTTYIRKGEKISYANTGSAISSGDVVVLGNSIGVAETDIAATTGTGSVYVEGVHSLAAVTGVAFSLGDVLYWDTSNSYLVKTATANTIGAGTCWAAKGSSAATAQVKLAGGAADVPRAAAVTALTDNSGGATADGTIGVVTAPTAIGATITDSTGLSGSHNDTIADGQVTDGTIGGTADGALETVGATNSGDVSGAIMNNFKDVQAALTVLTQNDSDLGQKAIELVTAQAENRTAIIALTDAIKEITTKQAAIISALKAANLMDQ